MNRRAPLKPLAWSILLGTLLVPPGCGPDEAQIKMAEAMCARANPKADYDVSARFIQSYARPDDKDFIMWAMDHSSLCLMGGNYDQAKAELLQCVADIENHQDTEKEKQAALSDESAKIFKGEPFERAMLCTYLGLLHYMDGDYNNARIFCTRANMADQTTAENMAKYRDDFQLAHFWLGKAYLKLGQEDNARIAFVKACTRVPRDNEQEELQATQRNQASEREKRMRLEAESYRLATRGDKPVPGATDVSASPGLTEMPETLPGYPSQHPAEQIVLRGASSREEMCSSVFQKDVNLILVVETGLGPIKYLLGENQFADTIIRAPYPERNVLVYLNGQLAGQAWQMLDLFHQADTRGTTEKDQAQVAKGVTQSILRRLPYIGYLADFWIVKGDHRYWHLLPGEVHVYAAKVRPGLYNVTIESFDSNGKLLPRLRLTRYYLPVREGQENIYMLHTVAEADNVYMTPKND
ncbi:MAG: hypothetical protein NTU94_00130 [Planctomycetota bacterium]|nr:hypothetical protein [Planctomycetota bacterium]